MTEPGLLEKLDTLTVLAWLRPRLLYALAVVVAVVAAQILVGWFG